MSDVAMLRIPRQLVLFRVGNTHYCLDIDAVDEILPLLAITPVAGAQDGVLGLADVRKRVVPVFDLHWKFGVPRPADERDSRLILVDAAQGPVALLVDAVEEVLTVQREDFQQVAPPGDRRGLGYLNGVVRRADSLVVWVDHRRLVPDDVTSVLQAA